MLPSSSLIARSVERDTTFDNVFYGVEISRIDNATSRRSRERERESVAPTDIARPVGLSMSTPTRSDSLPSSRSFSSSSSFLRLTEASVFLLGVGVCVRGLALSNHFAITRESSRGARKLGRRKSRRDERKASPIRPRVKITRASR